MLAKRLESIANLLQETGSVEVSDLSRRYGVTEKTIRQDLIKLEELRIATRVHGGALPFKGENYIFPVGERKNRYVQCKQRIAQRAYEMVTEDDIIFLDSGTTMLELAKLINKRVIVITPDPYIQNELLTHEMVTLYSTGGRLKREGGSCTFIGSDAVHMIRSYHAKKYFIGASSLSLEQGLMLFSTDEIEVKRAMLKAAQESIALIDASKIEQIAFVSLAGLGEINALVTDPGITEEQKARIEEQGVTVHVCAPDT